MSCIFSALFITYRIRRDRSYKDRLLYFTLPCLPCLFGYEVGTVAIRVNHHHYYKLATGLKVESGVF
jgi:hypothetical protein